MRRVTRVSEAEVRSYGEKRGNVLIVRGESER